MEKFLVKTIIKQPGMNPWKKDLKRDVYKEGDKHFIKKHGEFIEVEKVLDTWFIK